MTRRVSNAQARLDLRVRLEARAEDIKEAVLVRIGEIDPTRTVTDPTYAASLELAVGAAISYSLEALECGAARLPSAPPALRAQAALAARNGVGLDVVVRRCAAGHALVGRMIVSEAETLEIKGERLQSVLSDHDATLDRLVSILTREYVEEERSQPRSSAERQLWQVQRLLAGEALESTDVGYDLEGYHLAIAFAGGGAPAVVRAAVTATGRTKVLVAQPDDTRCWAWLGAARATDETKLEEVLRSAANASLRIAVGEPAKGLDGWRLSHRQATAALCVAQRGSSPYIAYRDAPLTAAAISDELLATSLRQLYLEPLESERDGGEVLRRTLRTYFSCEQNSASAAVALKVNRMTVPARIATVERRIGRSLISCAAGVQVALSLQLLEDRH